MNAQYIDIHTHQNIDHPEICSIVCASPDEDDGKSYYSWGIHPCFITNPAKQLQQVESAMQRERWIALGECGLDKLSQTPLAQQVELFEAQVLLSEQLHKPLVIHCVKAWAELIAVRRKIHPAQPWIIHGFRGKKELAEQLLREGLYLSFGRYYNEVSLLQAWPDRLLLETDDNPCSIIELYRKAAQVLQQPVGKLQTQILSNCLTLGFNL